jgi:proteasome assembly chaperone (PAC2) family protein
MLRFVLYRVQQEPELRSPVLVSGIEGWVDAGAVGSGTAMHIGQQAEVLVTFDIDQLLDYRSRRPILDVIDGAMKEMTWPELTIRWVRSPERDVLVLTGPEPDLRWHEFGDAIAELAGRFRIEASVCMGAIQAAVPHTRPTPVLATASRPGLLSDDSTIPAGLLRVPAAAINVVELRMGELGIPSVGFWGQVPHYAGGPYYPGMLAVLERVSRHLGTSFPAGELEERARTQRQELDEAVAASPEAVEYLTRLEEISDQAGVPSGESIAAEVERFLREASEGGGPSPLPGS